MFTLHGPAENLVGCLSPEFSRVSALMPKNVCIVAIERVTSLSQQDGEYHKRLAELSSSEDGTPPPTRELFHGTKSSNADSILSIGLQSAFNRTSMLGKGTYFSPKLELSLYTYTDVCHASKHSYVFLCDVIEKDTKCNSEKTIFVTPRDDSFRIKYLICFHKGQAY